MTKATYRKLLETIAYEFRVHGQLSVKTLKAIKLIAKDLEKMRSKAS